jgi:molecular chaperone GrpE (heat shock protein)
MKILTVFFLLITATYAEDCPFFDPTANLYDETKKSFNYFELIQKKGELKSIEELKQGDLEQNILKLTSYYRYLRASSTIEQRSAAIQETVFSEVVLYKETAKMHLMKDSTRLYGALQVMKYGLSGVDEQFTKDVEFLLGRLEKLYQTVATDANEPIEKTVSNLQSFNPVNNIKNLLSEDVQMVTRLPNAGEMSQEELLENVYRQVKGLVGNRKTAYKRAYESSIEKPIKEFLEILKDLDRALAHGQYTNPTAKQKLKDLRGEFIDFLKTQNLIESQIKSGISLTLISWKQLIVFQRKTL